MARRHPQLASTTPSSPLYARILSFPHSSVKKSPPWLLRSYTLNDRCETAPLGGQIFIPALVTLNDLFLSPHLGRFLLAAVPPPLSRFERYWGVLNASFQLRFPPPRDFVPSPGQEFCTNTPLTPSQLHSIVSPCLVSERHNLDFFTVCWPPEFLRKILSGSS